MPRVSGYLFYRLATQNLEEEVTEPRPCFGRVVWLWGILVAMIGTGLSGNPEVWAVMPVLVALAVSIIEKVRGCEGQFPAREYSKIDEPTLYWLATFTRAWAVGVLCLVGLIIALHMLGIWR